MYRFGLPDKQALSLALEGKHWGMWARVQEETENWFLHFSCEPKGDLWWILQFQILWIAGLPKQQKLRKRPMVSINHGLFYIHETQELISSRTASAVSGDE
jgi:hypothetical protein